MNWMLSVLNLKVLYVLFALSVIFVPVAAAVEAEDLALNSRKPVGCRRASDGSWTPLDPADLLSSDVVGSACESLAGVFAVGTNAQRRLHHRSTVPTPVPSPKPTKTLKPTRLPTTASPTASPTTASPTRKTRKPTTASPTTRAPTCALPPSTDDRYTLLDFKSKFGPTSNCLGNWDACTPLDSWPYITKDVTGLRAIEVSIGGCGLSGDLTTWNASALTKLEFLGLFFNTGLYGDLPSFSLQGLSSLTQLYLVGAQLTGDISKLTLAGVNPNFNMLDLTAAGDQLSGDLSLWQPSITSLASLYLLDDPQITGPIPCNLKRLGLQHLELSGTGVEGAYVYCTNCDYSVDQYFSSCPTSRPTPAPTALRPTK